MPRKRPADAPDDLENYKKSEPFETEMEEQLAAQAAETLNHFIRSFHISASTEMARNRLKSSLYLLEQRRHRKDYPVLVHGVAQNVLQGFKVQTSELPVSPDYQVKHNVKILLVNPNQIVINRTIILPKVPPIPTATMWTALTKNYEVEDEPTLKYFPYFGDDDEDDVVSEFYQIKQQKTSACEVEFTKAMCEGVLKTLQSTWDLTPSDLKRVANVIQVEEEVLAEVHKTLRLSQRISKKKRRMEVAVVANEQKKSNRDKRFRNDLLNPADQNITMEEYFQLYEKAADSYRSLFCRRCFVYDCDYHGCKEQPKLRILEQNVLALNMQEKERMINTGRNCGNNCFLGKVSLSNFSGFSKARGISAIFGWNKRTSVVCARSYLVCSGNFCEMAKMIGDKTCTEVAEMCAYYNINDRSLPKEARPPPKCRRSRKKKNWRMSIAHLQSRECDIDLCKLCSADEIVAREKDRPYHSHFDDTTKDGRSETTCQNRSIALGKQKHVRMGRSELGAAGWGLFVDDFVAKDEFIIEYIGEMVTQKEADRRGAVYDKVDRSYLFNLDTKTVIDSTRKGNKTRYINHSSKSPNCACKIMNVSSDFRIGLFATHDIQPHTELFFDYGYDMELYHAELLKQPTVTDWMKK